MRIIAFITESVAIQRILMHIGEPTQAPLVASARAPPAWEDFDQREAAGWAMNDSIPTDAFAAYLPVAPTPEAFAQTVNW